jgi:small-conductance mechanosensitive channel
MKENLNGIIEIIGNPLFSFDKVDISIFTLIKVILILAILQLVLVIFKRFIRYQIANRDVHQGDLMAIYHIVKYILFVIVIIMILNSLGINTTILLTSSAALMVGIGMGLQNIFKDILSGILILFGKVIRIGDIVQVGDVLGKVKHIHLRVSHIITREDIHMVIPNSKFVEDNVINWTMGSEQVRLLLKIGVAYGTDVELIKNILLKVAAAQNDVLKDPPPKVRFSDFGESSLDFQLLVWTDQVFSQEFVKSDLRYAIEKQFRDAKIEIPFPQRTVWHHNVK